MSNQSQGHVGHAQKKTRIVPLLPSAIEGNEIEGLSLQQLVEYHRTWKEKLADVPRLELELRAITKAIKKAAK